MTTAERVAHELRRLVGSQTPGGIFVVVKTVTEAKAQLSALVDRAAGGEEVIISKAAKQLPFWSRILTQAVSAGREGFAGESE